MHKKTLYMAVFFSGMCSLALEMAASRLLGNTYGQGQEVWASIIGLILIYLTVGNFLGGYWADRSPKYQTMFRILAWAAFTSGLIPLISRPVLRATANAFDQLQFGVMIGAFASILILFLIPVILLGTASPFAIRLGLQNQVKVGRTAGTIYGISTLGSFLGTFLPGLILIPLIGTYRSFLVISAILYVVSLIGLWRTAGWRSAAVLLWMPLVLAGLSIPALRGPDKNTEGSIFETESAYNYIQVLAFDDFRILRLNEGQGMHSMYHPTILDYNGPWEQVLAAPYFNPAPYDPERVTSMAILGLAAGTTARQATAVYGEDIAVDGIEIDPRIVDVAREHFGMTMPNLSVIEEDGRWALQKSSKKYQIISVDAYRPPYIPWTMTTREFFQLTRDRLTEDGALVINVGRTTDDRSLIDAIGSTIAAVYPSVYVVDVPQTFNSIIYATNQTTSAANLADNFAYLQSRGNTHPLLLDVVGTAVSNLQSPPQPSRVLTDDLAPVEWITSSMIIDFILSEDMETAE